MFRRSSSTRGRARRHRILALRERMAELAVVILDLETVVRQERSDRRALERRIAAEPDPVRAALGEGSRARASVGLQETLALQDEAQEARSKLAEELGLLVRQEAAAAELAMVRRARRGVLPGSLVGFSAGVALTAAAMWPEVAPPPVATIAAAPLPELSDVILVDPAEDSFVLEEVTDDGTLWRILQGANSSE